jgi:hypothetical protein
MSSLVKGFRKKRASLAKRGAIRPKQKKRKPLSPRTTPTDTLAASTLIVHHNLPSSSPSLTPSLTPTDPTAPSSSAPPPLPVTSSTLQHPNLNTFVEIADPQPTAQTPLAVPATGVLSPAGGGEAKISLHSQSETRALIAEWRSNMNAQVDMVVDMQFTVMQQTMREVGGVCVRVHVKRDLRELLCICSIS